MAHPYSPISHICTLGAKLLDPNAKLVAEWVSELLGTRTTASLSPPIATPHDAALWGLTIQTFISLGTSDSTNI